MGNESGLSKGQRTKQQILERATQVFREDGFQNSSIVNIAARIGITPASIYKYFDNKEAIYNELAVTFKNTMIANVTQAVDDRLDVSENIANIVRAYVSTIRDNTALYDTFRQIEFVNLTLAQAYYRQLTGAIRACLDKRARPDIDTETVAYAIVGSIYFVVIQSFLWGDGAGMVPEDIIPMVLNGIDARGDFVPYVLPRKRWVDPEKPAATQGEVTRRNILLAAEHLFGENGYHKTHTTDIARASGVGLGTIYLYFDSKKEILAELVGRVNHLLRACSSEYARPYTDRREIENAGFQAFFDVFEDRGEDYRIVREAEFVEKSVGVAYYQKIAEPYARGLEVATQRGEIIDIHPLLLSYALMGAGHTVGIRWYVIEKGQQLDDRAVLSMLQYVMHGVRGILKETE